MPNILKALQGASGNADAALYVEDVFSTYLYTGNGSTQTITNGIDLAGEGGLVWLKNRDGATNHRLYTTDLYSASNSNLLQTNLTSGGSNTGAFELQSFNSNGFTLGYSGGAYSESNAANTDYASWTFRKAPKFFDVVTYTGDGVTGRTVSHNLGSVPACIIIKRTDSTGNWMVHHSGTPSGITGNRLYLNTTGATVASGINVSDTSLTLYNSLAEDNISGATYVAYLFASDAGGFGDDGSENIIKCGSYGPNVSWPNYPEIDLGFEPQWVIIKRTDGTGNWAVVDNIRGIADLGSSYPYTENAVLRPNTSGAEFNDNVIKLTPTGFIVRGANGDYNGPSPNEYIYIAIRRPMKTPESGTEVFDANETTQDSTPIQTGLNTTDVNWQKQTNGTTYWFAQSRLTGNVKYLRTNDSTQELDYSSADPRGVFDTMGKARAYTSNSNVIYSFKRATGFFDVVAYTGDGVAGRTVSHNLGVAPEMIIVKCRSGAIGDWPVYHSGFNAGVNPEQYKARLNSIVTQSADSSVWNNTAPNQDNFTLGASSNVNASSSTYIAYLFGTIAGVSKVGRYTGNGTSQTINCGFSSGARFVLIKAANDFSDWNVFDTARGIVAGNDPYLKLNSTDAEVTTVDAIDPNSTGFDVVNGGGGYNMPNVNGVEYIFLAIA